MEMIAKAIHCARLGPTSRWDKARPWVLPVTARSADRFLDWTGLDWTGLYWYMHVDSILGRHGPVKSFPDWILTSTPVA